MNPAESWPGTPSGVPVLLARPLACQWDCLLARPLACQWWHEKALWRASSAGTLSGVPVGLLAGTPSGVPASPARPPGVPLLVLLNLSRASLSRNFQNPFVCKIYILSRSVALVLSGPPATMSHSNHPNLPKHEDRPHQPKPPKLAEAPELPKPGKHAELPEPAEPMEAPEPTETLEPPGPRSRPLGDRKSVV